MPAAYRKGTGPNALPQGAATSLNARQPKEDVSGTPLEAGADVPVVFSPGVEEPLDEGMGGYSENMQMLLDNPDPNYRPPMMPKARPGRMPTGYVRHLPQLAAMARLPNAPPALIGMYNLAVMHLENEMKRRGS